VIAVPSPRRRAASSVDTLNTPQSPVVVEHAHRSGGLVHGVPAAVQLGTHPSTALVNPRGVAIDASGSIGRIHPVDGRRALAGAEIAVEQCVVEHLALRVAREHRRRDAAQALE
jgi:hypothetical protein